MTQEARLLYADESQRMFLDKIPLLAHACPPGLRAASGAILSLLYIQKPFAPPKRCAQKLA